MGAPTKKLYTPEWMTLGEAAARLSCHPQTIRNRIRSGAITGVRVVQLDRVVRINRADWAAYLDRRAAEHSKPA